MVMVIWREAKLGMLARQGPGWTLCYTVGARRVFQLFHGYCIKNMQVMHINIPGWFILGYMKPQVKSLLGLTS